MRRIAALSARLAVTASLGLTGCCYYELRDSMNECCYNVRIDYSARRAWCRCEDNFDGHPHKKYFGRGFHAGYTSVAQGGDGCCPTIPPNDCWGWCFDACEGQERMNAWFDGWSAGAIAAESDGLVGSGRIIARPPACTSGCNASGMGPTYGGPGYGGPGYPPAPGMPLTPGHSHLAAPPVEMAPIGPPNLPPPAPPALTPAVPADEAYESYDEGGVYSP